MTAIENEIPDVSSLVKKTDLNAKIAEIESKIPGITGLATNSALTVVENEIPDVSSLVKKADYDAKILDIENKVANHDHDKYITTSEFNKVTTENFKARLTKANLVTKTDFDTTLQNVNKKLLQIKQGICLLEMNLKNYKKLIWLILEAKIILAMMAHKIILYFS